MLCDAHCHVHDERLKDSLKDVLDRCRESNILWFGICACDEEDWDRLEQFMTIHSEEGITFHPSFGIHPWNTSSVIDSDYLMRLREKLTQYPTAGLGEIGLCKSKRGLQVPLETQLLRFRQQLELGIELQRTITIHCVGYIGRLTEILLKLNKPVPPIILHSFPGSVEVMKQLKGMYISFSCKQVLTSNRKVLDCLKVMDLNRLLLESDAPDQQVNGLEPPLLPAALERVHQVVVARSDHQLSLDQLRDTIRDNTKRAFQV